MLDIEEKNHFAKNLFFQEEFVIFFMEGTFYEAMILLNQIDDKKPNWTKT